MNPGFAGRVPTLWYGHGVARRMIERLTAGRETLVIADAAVTIRALAGRSATTIPVDAGAMDVATVVSLAEDVTRRRPDVIVAVGGGSILDASKIAALALAPGRLFDFAIERASTSALTLLPLSVPPIDVVAVPTTIGTSSETNRVGILTNLSGHRLIIGDALRPRHALIDPSHLASLTSAAVREGALEAFLRLAGASTGSRRGARGKSDAVALARALLHAAAPDDISDASRLRLARLSAATQRTAALRGPDPYSSRHWYVANEVAFVLETRKMAATAAVIAAVWRRIGNGDPRWGDRDGLGGFWSQVASEAALPPDPSEGIAALIDRWGIPRPQRPTAHEARRIAAAIERSWGNRYPMLAGLVAEDFIDVLRDSSWSLPTAGLLSRPSTIGAKEVN